MEIALALPAVSTGAPATEIANCGKQFQEIQYEQAEKISKTLDINIDMLLDDYTKFAAPGYGERAKEIRTAPGASQARFSEMLGASRSTLAVREAEDHNHRPSRENYLRIISRADRKEACAV